MSWFLVLFAFIGVAVAVPTPSNTLPESVLGVFENVPSESKNYEEFVKVFGLPKHAKFDNNLIEFWKEGDTYHHRFVFWPTTLTFDLPFKLGETQTITSHGKQLEYVYTLESGDDPETPVIRVKYRQLDGDIKFSVEATFTNEGINATYTRNNIVAHRIYRRTLPPYVLGSYEADPTRVPDEAIEFWNSFYPLPGGLKWTKNIKLWIGREGNHFVDRVVVSPEYAINWRFKLDEPKTLMVDNNTIKVVCSIVETDANKTTLRTELTTSQGKLVYTTVFDREGATSTAKTDTKEFTAYYKRVLPGIFYGTYEEMPEKTENWEEFVKGDDGHRSGNGTEFRIYRKASGEYAYKKTGKDKTPEFSFKLDTPLEFALPDGKQLKFNITLLTGNSTHLVTHTQTGDRKYSKEDRVTPSGLDVTYRRGDVEAKKFFRRVIPKTVLGTFEAPAVSGDEAFTTYANSHGHEALLKKTTIEITELPDHKYQKTVTYEGDEPKVITFVLGEPIDIICKKTGKTMTVKMFYHETDNKPTLMSVLNEHGTNNVVMRTVGFFTPEGLQSTLIYGIPEHKEQLHRRTFTRKGAAVPFELPNAA